MLQNAFGAAQISGARTGAAVGAGAGAEVVGASEMVGVVGPVMAPV
jgi:uncharacterized membrane protein